jgi:ribosomal protein S18 acetylase RimI-like enzyme
MWRPSRPDDDPAIIEMSLALYAEDPSDYAVDAEQVGRTLARLRAEPTRGRVLVLDLGQGIQGYALLISFWSNELGGELCVVDELYVQPRARSRGHAARLIEAVARGEGDWPGRPVALELEVSPHNPRARRLYERLGFVPLRNATLRLMARPSR